MGIYVTPAANIMYKDQVTFLNALKCLIIHPRPRCRFYKDIWLLPKPTSI